jgi:hypothetical protein
MEKCSSFGCEETKDLQSCKCKDNCGFWMCPKHMKVCSHCKRGVLYDPLFNTEHHTGCIGCVKCGDFILFGEINLVHDRPYHLNCIPKHLKQYARSFQDSPKKNARLQEKIQDIEKGLANIDKMILELRTRNNGLKELESVPKPPPLTLWQQINKSPLEGLNACKKCGTILAYASDLCSKCIEGPMGAPIIPGLVVPSGPPKLKSILKKSK